MRVQVMTPEKTFFSGDAHTVVVNAEKGQLTILDQHADLITLVKPGRLRIVSQNQTLEFDVSEGVLRIEGPKCSVLAQAVQIAA